MFINLIDTLSSRSLKGNTNLVKIHREAFSGIQNILEL